VRTYVKMLKETRDVVQKALDQGQTLDQMRQAKLLDPWKKFAGPFVSADIYLETLYYSLSGAPGSKFVPHN
jgi:hypothetical protein